MLKNLKKYAALCLSLTILLTAVTGCSKAKTKDASAGNPVKEEAPKEVIRDLGGRTIKFYAWFENGVKPGNVSNDRYLERVKELEKKHNFKIEWNGEAIAKGEDFLQKITVSTMSGDPIGDVIYINAKWFNNLAGSGVLYPIGDLKSFDGFKDTEKWSSVVKDFTTYNGKVWGYSRNPLPPWIGLFYNKTMFKANGLPDLYELQKKGEWTWDKFYEIAKALTKDTNGDGNIDQYGVYNSLFLGSSMIISNNGSTVEVKDGKGTFEMGSPNSMEALNFYQKLINEKVVKLQPSGSNWDWYRTEFANGTAGMLPDQWSATGKLKTAMKDDYGYVFFPKGPKAKDYVSEMGGLEFSVIPASVKNPDDVAFIIQELSKPYPDEKPEDWKEGYYANARDKEAVDLTLTQIIKDQKAKLNKSWYANDIQNKVINDIATGGLTPAAAIEKHKPVAEQNITNNLQPAK
jgi:ABC-type glycerol-3-phosphate transport system substrate-binding protein